VVAWWRDGIVPACRQAVFNFQLDPSNPISKLLILNFYFGFDLGFEFI